MHGMVRCIRVPKEDGNPVRIRLKDADMLDLRHRITADGDSLLIPITGESFEDFPVEEAELRELEHQETDYRNLLPEDVRSVLPSSYDCIGDVIVVKLVDELLPLKHDIGEALIKVNKNVRLVLLDRGVKGELRIRDLKPIAGEGSSETKHRESGVTMLTDPSTVYFNPRLATERMRVASMVKDGETIIDMFAGVAPFGLVILKHAHPRVVYSIDLNYDAVEYMIRNIHLNHVKGLVPIEGDASKEVYHLPMADRVIMNLPQMAWHFLPDALARTNPGGTIHMHRINERETAEADFAGLIADMNARGLKCRLDAVHELKTYSPTASVYVLDIIRE